MFRKFSFFIIALSYAWQACSAQPWAKPDDLRLKNLLKGRYDSAAYYADEAMAFIRGIKGENDLLYARSLNNMAVSHFYLGSYKKAKYYILKEVALREALKADDDIAYLKALEDASIICRRSGDYEEALKQVKKAEKKSLRINGSNTPGYARTISDVGGVYYDMGASVNDMVYLKGSLDYLQKAEAINLKFGDRSKFALMLNRYDIAAYNNDIGNIPTSEILLQDIVNFAEKEKGASSPYYGAAVNNLGLFYYNTGDYKLAEKYLVDAIDVFSKDNNAGGMRNAICLNNLGALYHEMGNYKIAAKLIADAQKMMESDRQQNNPAFAIVLNNKAAVYISQEYYSSPENKSIEQLNNSGKLLLRADSIFGMNCQNPHPDGFVIKANLSIWYNMTGDKKKAVKIFYDQTLETNLSLKVLALMNKMTSSAVIPVTEKEENEPAIEPMLIPVRIKMLDQVSLSNMNSSSTGESDGITNALLELIMGKATNLKKAVGQYHPSYAEALKSLITFYGASDITDTEEELTLEYMNVLTQRMLRDFSFLSESEKEMYYQTRLTDIHSFLSYSLLRKRENPAITCHTYNTVLLNKGLMLKSSTAMRLAILNSKDAELLRMYDEWIALQKEISGLYSTPVELRTKNLSELEEKANQAERSLVSRSQDFSDYRKGIQVKWEDVKASLKPGEAAIEFIDFKKRERNGGDDVVYSALIVRPDSKYPEMLRLFSEDQLKGIIGQNVSSDAGFIGNLYGTLNAPDERLYNLIWKPLEPFLGGIKTVYISPSGLLNKISFPAIGKSRNTFLCDQYQIQVKGTTSGIAGENAISDSSPSALIFGGIRYSQENSGSPVWAYLEGTKAEGDAVNSILAKGSFRVSYLTDNNATETYFKQNAGNYNFLHMATHGFFFDDPNEVRFEEKKENTEYGDITFRGGSGFGVNNFVNSDNPLMRSGLVLAGANDVWVKKESGGTDDGVLTAQEVTQIDMRKNNLVVLSACETGLGDIKGNEGVYGLQRALKMAGVKNIIMSLWEIPDRETVEFMGKFYDNFLKVRNIRTAFADAQHEMRLKYDPYFWAAFVLME